MNSHTTDQDDRRPVTERVTVALDELAALYRTISEDRSEDPAARAMRADRLALVCARRAGWWRLLLTRSHRPELSSLFAVAVMHAAASQHDDARFWRDSASDWRARAEQRPTSDAAGAMSNHHDLGIAS